MTTTYILRWFLPVIMFHDMYVRSATYISVTEGLLSKDHSQGAGQTEKGGNALTPPDTNRGDGFDTTAIIITTTCASVTCCVIAVVTCMICIRRNRARRRKLTIRRQLIGMDARNPFNITPVPNQINDCEESHFVDVNRNSRKKQCVEIATERRVIPFFRLSESPSSHSESEDSGRHSRPPSSLSTQESSDCCRTERHPDLLPDTTGEARVAHRTFSISEMDVSFDERAFDKVVKTTFTVTYDEWDFTLTVTLHNVSNLQPKANWGDVFAVLSLMPEVDEKKRTRCLPCVSDYVCFEERYVFKNVRTKMLENGTLRISIYRRKKVRKGKKDSLLGEMFMKFSDIDLQRNVPTRFSKLDAPRKRLTQMSTSDKLLRRSLGELFVDLQYQPLANRLKVFVRRANQLPPNETLLVVKPVYYVVVRLLKDDAVMEVQKTRTSGGRGALWNQAFLFNIVGGGIHSYSLEFLVMKGKLHKKDLVVGKVEIGPNSSRVGREHWKCMISPRPIDVAKWHNILPVFAY